MPDFTSSDSDLTEEQAANVRILASLPELGALLDLAALPPSELAALLDLARAQAKLDAACPVPSRPSLRIVGDGVIVHPVACRRRREAEQRDEAPPACRWRADSAGGHTCSECGTWAKPDSGRARVLDRLARSGGDGLRAPFKDAKPGLVHVSELRVGDTFRFQDADCPDGFGSTRFAHAVSVMPGDDAITVHSSRVPPLGASTLTRCVDDGPHRVMVEIISRSPNLVHVSDLRAGDTFISRGPTVAQSHDPDNRGCPWNNPETFASPATCGFGCECIIARGQP